VTVVEEFLTSMHTVQLTNDSDGIEIAKSGAPEPSAAMLAWLASDRRGDWRHECGSAFNVFFHLESTEDAARVRARCGSVPA
jgi:hypothetical protein